MLPLIQFSWLGNKFHIHKSDIQVTFIIYLITDYVWRAIKEIVKGQRQRLQQQTSHAEASLFT